MEDEIPVEMRVEGTASDPRTIDFVRKFVSEGARLMQVPKADILRVFLCDEHNFGAVLNELAPGTGFTNDGIYLATGKTVPIFNNGTYLGSNLLLHPASLAAFGRKEGEDEGQIDVFSYVLFHELGHMVDHRKRPEERINYAEIKSHTMRCGFINSATVLEEYAACFFSAPFLSVKGFEHISKETTENLRKCLGIAVEQHGKFSNNEFSLLKVSGEITLQFWRCLIEFAKIFALLHGNPTLAPNGSVNLSWPGTGADSGALLIKLNNDLRTAWANYPECDADFTELSITAWFHLALSEGYMFNVEDRGDSLYFR